MQMSETMLLHLFIPPIWAMSLTTQMTDICRVAARIHQRRHHRYHTLIYTTLTTAPTTPPHNTITSIIPVTITVSDNIVRSYTVIAGIT